MLEFCIIAHGLYRPEQVVVDYNPTLCMPTIPSIRIWMDRCWQQKLIEAQARGIQLFDAPLFRLIEVSSCADGILHLLLGDTCYKEYVTTRMPEFASTHTLQELSNTLAVCSVIETSDNYILLDKRQGVDVYAGRYHVIGGFFERSLDMDGVYPDPFAAMCREIREETGIRMSDIIEQYCLGVVYDRATPHNEMCFLTRLSISLEEVIEQRTPEDNEVKQLHRLQGTADSVRDFILCHHGNISATGEPNLLLYGAQKFGAGWFGGIMDRIKS